MTRSLHELAHTLNTLTARRDAVARELLEHAARLPLLRVHALKSEHARLTRRITRLVRLYERYPGR